MADSLTAPAVYKNNRKLVHEHAQRIWGVGLPAPPQCGLWSVARGPFANCQPCSMTRSLKAESEGLEPLQQFDTAASSNVCPFSSNSCLLPLTKVLVQERLGNNPKDPVLHQRPSVMHRPRRAARKCEFIAVSSGGSCR